VRDPTTIHLDEAIVHIVNPRGAGLVLSDVPLALTGNLQLGQYFRNHIRNSLQNTGIRAARFVRLEAGAPSGLIASLLAGHTDLVHTSRTLAEQLYTILERDHRTKGSVLAVCLYRADNYPGQRFLALLKVDPSAVFRYRHGTNARGRYVDLELDAEALTQENLQKSAFVQALRPRHEDYDMMLLDTQVKDGQRRDIAKYFAVQYLKAEDSFDDRRRTETLYTVLASAHNQLRDSLTQQENEDLDEARS
jgi:37-kD nucleoid-associated bacterial protein